MICEEAKPLIDPYADGELDAMKMVEVERHLQNCPSCVLALERAGSLSKAIRREALYFPAPVELQRSVRSAVRSRIGSREKFWSWSRLTAWAPAAAASLLLLWAVLLLRPSARGELEREIVSAHVRSLMANHAMDVASSDQHTVKPWFNGKLDFSPPVKDLVARGYPLIGGRLDYLDGRGVAALVFQRHRHTINLFIWPVNETDSRPAARPPSQGYHVARWSQGGMVFWAVSDLNEAELMEFAGLFAAAEPPPAGPR